MKKITDIKNKTIFLLTLMVLVLSSCSNIDNNTNISNKIENNFDKSCITSVEQRTVRGTSLSGLIESGTNIIVLFGCYNCNPVQRNDIVLYDYKGNDVPVIKIVKAIPGDSFRLVKHNNNWNIIVNDQILKNSQNQSYVFDERGKKMLSLYEKDYNGIIPENAYLLLSNLASGSIDSSRFGLIDRSDILGKILT